MMDVEQGRPSDAEFDQMIAHSYNQLHQSIRLDARPWWRKLSRFTVITSFVVAGGVAGGAYAATQVLFPAPPEVIAGGGTVVHLDEPARGDKWLNIGMKYNCRPGEHLRLKNGDAVIFAVDCDAEGYSADDATVVSRGVSDSIPIGEVRGRTLTLDSNLTRDFRIKATFGPIKVVQQIVLPGRGGDGMVDWTTPDYEVNKYGLTVGPMMVNVPEGQEPDLVPVDFEGGVGYLLTKEMISDFPTDPDEIEAREDEQRRLGLLDDEGNIYTRVYAADGKTVLGKILTGTSSSE